MTDVALFDLEPAAWSPITQPPWVEPEGTKAEQAAAWKAYAKLYMRCRDCGTSSKLNAGGGSNGVGYMMCDDCAALDGAAIRTHHAARCEPRPQTWGWTDVVADCPDCTWDQWSDELIGDGAGVKTPVADEVIAAAISEHNAPRWSGRWGKGHELDEHDGLVRAQAQRRAKFASVSS